jgi:thiol:disulfide interchange protein DsbD
MFDLFTIQTPSSFAGKIQGITGKLKGSIPGTFIMGGLSAFVIGPCISGPLLGLIIYVMQTGEIIRGFAYFFSLAWGMSIILFIAGVSSGVLPKAGEWMNRVKHVLGVVLIWAGFLFTRPIVGETVYWTAGIVAAALGLAAMGLFRFPEAGEKKTGIVHLLIGIMAFGLFVYFVSCRTEKTAETPKAEVQLESIISASQKPVVLDFTAPWCYNCKEIEKTVLSRDDVKEQLAEFTFVKVDFDSNPKLRERFNIIGPPAFVFVDKNGKQIGKTVVTGEELENALFSFDSSQYKK